MANPTSIPTTDASKLALFKHLGATLPPTYAAQLDVSNDTLSRLNNATAWVQYAIDYQAALKKGSTAATALKAAIVDGPVTGSLALPALNPPAPPSGPPFEDANGFLADLIAVLKRHRNYTDTLGQILDILPGKAAPPDLVSLRPLLTYTLNNGHPDLDWSKNGMDSLEIEVDRGAGFALLTIDTQPGYLDTAPLPAVGTTALWRYRGIYRLKDERVGVWSEVLEVAVKGV
jgi:hypothetical protein